MHAQDAFAHFLITRFNVPMSFGSAAWDGDPWFDHRLDLFARYCLPSVAAQSCTRFTWLILIHPETPPARTSRLEKLLERGGVECDLLRLGVGWVKGLRHHVHAAVLSRHSHVVTTRFDNDDAVHRDFIAAIQARFRGQDRAFVDFPNGYFYNHRLSTLRRMDMEGSSFVSLVERASADLTTVFCGNHVYLSRNGPFERIPGLAAWVQVGHGRNVMNREQGRLVWAGGGRVLRREFGWRVGWAAALRRFAATWAIGTAEALRDGLGALLAAAILALLAVDSRRPGPKAGPTT